MTELSLEQRAEKDYHQNLTIILTTLGKIPYIYGVNIPAPSPENKIRLEFSVHGYGRADFDSLVKEIIKGNRRYHVAGYIKILNEVKSRQETGELFDSWAIEIDAQAENPKARTMMNAGIVAKTKQMIEQYYNKIKDHYHRDVKPDN